VLTVLVIGGRLALDPIWGRQHNRHLVFLPTVIAAAWLGGFGPGLLSTTLTALALSLFWLDAGHALTAHVDLGLFVLAGVAISALVQSMDIARTRAAAALKSREQLLAVVAHDLRNPLAAVKMTSHALGRLLGDCEATRRMHIIDRAVVRMDDLIRDLIDTARIEHGELTVELAPEPVDAVVQEAAEIHAPLARERGLTLEVQPPGGAPWVLSDHHRLLQALGNLLGNALRFTPEGGRITLRAEELPQGILFAVDDTGPGIPRGDLPRIFERYWSADAKGTGLGLYIAQSIVRAHGGDLAVRTDLGHGSSFSFVLRRAAIPGTPV
jgi:signal transduction histidine kinase